MPFICTETHEMGEEILASYLYQVHLCQWLEAVSYTHLTLPTICSV